MYPKAGRYSLPSSPGTPRAHPSWPRHNSRVQQPLPGQLKILAAVTVFVVLAYFLLYPTLNKTEVEAVVPQFGGTVTSSENVDPSSPDQVDGGVLPEPSPTTKGRPKSKIESWREKIDSVNPWNHHKGNSTNVSNVRPSMVGTSSSPVPSPTLRAILSQALVRGSLPTELPVPSLSKPPPPPIRIVKISALFGDSSSAMQRALRTHEIHNRMHGYQMSVARRSILDDTWTKPAYILSIVLRELAKPDGEHAEWVFWVDADTIIINPYVQIEVFLPPAGEWDDVHMLVTKDWNGLNNGVFPLRVCQWSVEFLSAILAYRLYRPAADLTFRDQSAMDALLKEDRFSSHVLNVPQRWFNAYYGDVDGTIETYQIRRGEFLVHFPGLTDRDQLMEPWLQRAERHAPDWELELIHTTYPEEVEKFWEEARRERSNNIEKVEEVHQQCAELWEECEKWIRDWRIDFSLDVVNEIQGKIREVKEIVDGEMKARLEVVMNAYEDLRNASKPMEVELGRARKAVVKQAHDAIFAAEHATLTDTESEDTQQMVGLVQDQISRLKEVIVSDYWPKGQVIGMIDQLKATQKALENKINEENENVVTEMEASEDGSSEALQVLEASDTENGDGTAVPEGEAANDTGRRPSPTLITFLVRRP